MATIRVPYPADPALRKAVFDRAAAKLGRFGTYRGTEDAGDFQGATPLGSFAGTYHSDPRSDLLVIELTRKPMLIPTSLIENEIRRQMATC